MRSALLVAVLLSLFGVGRASADPHWESLFGRHIEVRYPTGQVYQQDRLVPLQIEFGTPATAGRTYRIDWPSQSMRIPDEWRALEVPPGETRALSMVLPPNRVSSLYSLRVNDHPLRLDLTSSNNQPVIGVLAPPADRFDYLRSLAIQEETSHSNSYGEEPESKLVPLGNLARLESELIPYSWGSLDSLDLIVVYNWNLLGLDDRQTRALLDWTGWRGHLVLVSNGLAEEFHNSLLEPHLPFRATSIRTSEELVQVVGEPREGSEVLAEFEGLPLAVSRPHLQGRITFITAPLTRLEPLTQDRAEELWKAMVKRISPPDGIAAQGSSGYLITDMPELPRVQAGYVVLLVLLYAVVVGPVNLTYLRRRDKMLRSFITIPVIAIFFAAAVYLMSLANRSSVPVIREIGVTHFPSGSTVGLAGSELVLYSPYRAQYRLDTEPSTIIGEFSYRSHRKPMSVYLPNGQGGLSSTVAMSSWDLLATESRSLKSIDQPVRMSLEGNTLTVESPWETESEQACFWHLERGVSAPFTLHQGENRIELDFVATPDLRSFGQGLFPSEWTIESKPGRQRLMSSALANIIVEPKGELTGRLLLWTDRLPSEVTTEPAATIRSDTLVVYDFSQKPSAGETE